MQVLNVVVPDDVGRWVVTYYFSNWTGDIERRMNFNYLPSALEAYKHGIEYIGSSEDYEKVAIYYVIKCDDKLQNYQCILYHVYMLQAQKGDN